MTARTAYGLNSPRDRRWQQDANCGPATAEMFWLTGHHTGRAGHKLSDDNRAALALCDTCPVLAKCLADELQHPTPYPHVAGGRVWGVR